jgi:hypothetical protein
MNWILALGASPAFYLSRVEAMQMQSVQATSRMDHERVI